MLFLNLTPHELTIHGINGPVVIQSSGLARLSVTREKMGDVGGFAVNRTVLGEPSGVPDKVDGTVLIVSAMVAEHPSLRDRGDICYPGEAIRDEIGKIVGANGLCSHKNFKCE